MTFPINLYSTFTELKKYLNQQHIKRIHVFDFQPFTGGEDQICKDWLDAIDEALMDINRRERRFMDDHEKSLYTQLRCEIEQMQRDVRYHDFTKLICCDLYTMPQEMRFRDDHIPTFYEFVSWHYGRILLNRISRNCPFLYLSYITFRGKQTALLIFAPLPTLLCLGLIMTSPQKDCQLAFYQHPIHCIGIMRDALYYAEKQKFSSSRYFLNKTSDILDDAHNSSNESAQKNPKNKRIYLVNPSKVDMESLKNYSGEDAYLVISNSNGTCFFQCKNSIFYQEVCAHQALTI